MLAGGPIASEIYAGAGGGASHVLGAGRRTNRVRDAADQSHEGCRPADQSHLTVSGALAGEGPDQGGGGAQG
jgi:hypothetical protein